MNQNNFWISVQEKVIYFQLFLEIIPEYSPILFTTYYSQNYASIIDACLAAFNSVASPAARSCLLR